MSLNVDHGIFSRPKVEEHFNGDQYFIDESNGFFFAVIADGLGHGIYANEASKLAIEHIKENLGESIEEMIGGCHKRLRGTRGVALSIVRIDLNTGRITFGGVGNVECKCFTENNDFHPVPFAGIVGYNLRKIRTFSGKFQPGDMFCMHSDGISSRFEIEDKEGSNAQEMAGTIAENHGKPQDDSTVLVVRMLEG